MRENLGRGYELREDVRTAAENGPLQARERESSVETSLTQCLDLIQAAEVCANESLYFQ